MQRAPSEDEADRLLAATLYLMSCHARNGCPRLACMIEHHLRMVATHPHAGEYVRDIARKMGCAWNAVRAHDERRAAAAKSAALLH